MPSDTEEDSEESADDSLVTKKTEVEEVEPGPQQLPQMSLDYGGALLPGEVCLACTQTVQIAV